MTEIADNVLGEVPAIDRVLEQSLRDLDIPPRPLIIDRIKAEMGSVNPNQKYVGQLQQDFWTDHAMVGCLLAQNWWLPEESCPAIRHHHDRSPIDFFDSGLPASSAIARRRPGGF
ncbi:HDOD domain-containing protein [Accumulibacter sp.]|uniref:HDOD domain-containing protein n=1 Tax=Accumulibacter sp. TaxID=2053492 RepID=UPI002CD5AD84|nr:HDOD domain-containing protein [Accumulibacter sp.]HPU80913.1 HDOD domain-containing protein [Accumulibacter sp.]